VEYLGWGLERVDGTATLDRHKKVFVSNKCQYSQLGTHALSHVRMSLQYSQTTITILFRTKTEVFCTKHLTVPSLFTLIEAFDIK